MSASASRVILEPADEYCHEPDAATSYNESMYLNALDPARGVGAWFRLGNRVREGQAEMSCCVYLPDGRVGFMFKRPRIESNAALDAGGLCFEVVEPLRRLRLTYAGSLCVLARPRDMADPARAFRENPVVRAAVTLDCTGLAPPYGGRPVAADGAGAAADPAQSFARAHYEQHVAIAGTIAVGDERWPIAGLGLRDKSWGPRFWQAIRWYRWLPISFGPDFGMVLTLIGGERTREAGMVMHDGAYVPIRTARIESEWDADGYQTALRAEAHTDTRRYEVTGRVRSLIPLRNRRTAPDGVALETRITEGLTEYRCDGRVGWGLSEYLDQIVDGRPVGPDVRPPRGG
jgi:hypothetical protein